MMQRGWRKPGAFLKPYEDQRRRKECSWVGGQLLSLNLILFFSCPQFAAHLGGTAAYHLAKINIPR